MNYTETNGLRHVVPFLSTTDFVLNAAVARTRVEQKQLKLFGANVRRERIAIQLTQERLAELTDLNIRNLQKIEAGETNVLVTTVTRIRKALGCSADKLIPLG